MGKSQLQNQLVDHVDSTRVHSETRLCILFYLVVLASSSWVLYSSTPTSHQHPIEDIGWISEVLMKLPGRTGSPGLDACILTGTLVSAVAFIAGELTGNWSQIDKLWSLLPGLYVWLVTLVTPHPRLYLMTGVATVWGGRLTYNFWRRGGYSWPPWRGEEDYRWEYVRKWPVINTRVGSFLFNLLFICIYQNVLLLLTASPAIICSGYDSSVTLSDWLLTVSCVLLVYIEYTADQQQYDFQTQKWRLKQARQKVEFPYSVGFPTHGLFSVSRHPNYTAEMSVWFVFYLFTLSAGASTLNWSLVGSVLLCLLFQGSSKLSESITTRKYPLYKRYRLTVPRFLGPCSPTQPLFKPVIR